MDLPRASEATTYISKAIHTITVVARLALYHEYPFPKSMLKIPLRLGYDNSVGFTFGQACRSNRLAKKTSEEQYSKNELYCNVFWLSMSKSFPFRLSFETNLTISTGEAAEQNTNRDLII